MDFLHFTSVSFEPGANIGQLCEDLHKIIGQGIYYDTFKIQNTKWLWLVNDIVAVMKNDKILCGCLGLFPTRVAGILNSVKEIHFYALCEKELN